jgi:predicted chitinase
MTPDTLIEAMKPSKLPRDKATSYLPLMERAMIEYQITSRERSAMWLAQVGHESCGLVYFEELASGQAYEGRKDLCNTQPGDGPRFKGRGPIQVTGRCNYTNAEKALGLPLTSNPSMAAQPAHGFRISAWWWWNAGVNPLADKRDVVAATKRINGGTNGLADRQARYDNCWRLGAAVLPAPGGAGQPTGSEDELMTATRYWGSPPRLYRAMRGQDGRVYYSGPDTKGAWHMVDEKYKTAGGVSMDISPTGEVTISSIGLPNRDCCSHTRASGGGKWVVSYQGGKA